jgi:hypothetical protein
VAVKYRNLKRADEVWSGGGRLPLWLGAGIEAGKDREDFLVLSEASKMPDRGRSSALVNSPASAFAAYHWSVIIILEASPLTT